MKKLYGISGLGADERVFSKLQLPGMEMQYLRWLAPHEGEGIQDYAKRMGEQLDEENPVLVGVSFGGMMAIEIARQFPVAKIILISSVKSRRELPDWMKLAGRLKLDNLVPQRPWSWLGPIENKFLGARGIEERQLANEFRQTVDPHYLHWAIRQVINWENQWQPSSVFHIHGSRDKTFPLSKIHATHVIKGGGHFMVMNRAQEISGIIRAIVDGTVDS
jgi:pimeloyl-ACP methyl ester carboxylesterase